MAIIALAIILDSPGSPFFIQERVGKDRRRFRMVKFRTMRADHDDSRDRAFMQAYVAGRLNQGDEEQAFINKPIKKGEITRVGRILRKTSLDELPQLVNVVRGEMSLIGPRPNVPWEVEEYQEWHFERLDVRPGITGYAQVYGRSSLSFDEIAARDIHYVRHIGLKMDLHILWRTFWIVFSGRGAG